MRNGKAHVVGLILAVQISVASKVTRPAPMTGGSTAVDDLALVCLLK